MSEQYEESSLKELFDLRIELTKQNSFIDIEVALRAGANISSEEDETLLAKSDFDLEEMKKNNTEKLLEIDKILSQRQYNIFVFLNADPNGTRNDKKMFNEIKIIKKLPKNIEGDEGIVFTFRNKSYEVRVKENFYQSNSIIEYEGSLIL